MCAEDKRCKAIMFNKQTSQGWLCTSTSEVSSYEWNLCIIKRCKDLFTLSLEQIFLTPRGAGCFYYVVGQGGADSAPPHNPYQKWF